MNLIHSKVYKRKTLSGRGDLNSRPLGPEPSALARLRYAPINKKPIFIIILSLFYIFELPTLAPTAPRASQAEFIPPTAGLRPD